MSDYAHRPGGALKFKGEGEKKKKKKSSHSATDRAKVEADIADKEKERERIGSPRAVEETKAASSSGGRKLTEAERRFEETQRKRRDERVAKMAKQTHKDRVQEYNAKLDLLSEHHDLPRIGPG